MTSSHSKNSSQRMIKAAKNWFYSQKAAGGSSTLYPEAEAKGLLEPRQYTKILSLLN